jgi:hypothetical protein
MTDRELLELAAKAAGLRLDQLSGRGVRREADGQPVYWNPLTDNADAFRLAVKLGIDVSFPLYRKPDPPTVHAGRYWDTYVSCWYPFEERKGDDPYAATRRAIVRAAAEIGKAQSAASIGKEMK